MKSVFSSLSYLYESTNDFLWKPYKALLPIPASQILIKGLLLISAADSGEETPRNYTCYLLSTEIVRVFYFGLKFA